MLTVQAALQQGTELLAKAQVPAPRLTAEVLLGHAMQRPKAYLYAHSTDQLSELAWIHYGRYLHARINGQPTQYITKTQEFYGRDFRVTPDVLIPRPETEHLVETALEAIKISNFTRIVDIGTGSGAIAISVALESSRPVFASDISEAAIGVARQNRDKLDAPVSFFAADLASSIRRGSIDLLISNPPYIPQSEQSHIQQEVREWEPHIALFGGSTGLELYRRLITEAESVVKQDGTIMMELGYRLLEPVQEMLRHSWRDLRVVHDLAGLPRVTVASRR